MNFYTDLMLGKLCKWLRIFGFDTLLNVDNDLNKVKETCLKENRIFLTRSKKNLNEMQLDNSLLIESENFQEQIKQIFRVFNLSLPEDILTRCLICNLLVVKVDKESVKDKIPEKSLQHFSEFFRCTNCGKIYWKGTHYENTLKKIASLGL
jgi:hypothetical protein